MKYSTFKPIFPLHEDNELINTSFSTSSLPELIEKLKAVKHQSDEKLSAIIFFNSSEKQILLTAFREGAKFISFQSDHSITFQIVEGKVMFHTAKESLSLEKGQKLELKEKIPYSLTSHEDSLLLLTIVTNKKSNLPLVKAKFQDINYGTEVKPN